MKNFYTTSILKASVAIVALATSQASFAEWEKVHQLPTCQAHFITSKGTHLLSDFDDNRKGGIWYSDDKGGTWTKTSVKDFNYHKFYEADGYVFAMGYNARIARSADDGRTWEVLNYTSALNGVIDTKDMEALVAYGIVKVDDKLYIGDFAGGGMLISPDNGETWSLADRESLYINVLGEKLMDSFYNLVYYKGHIYAFGAMSVHRYDIAADKWETVNVKSNFMAVSTIFDDRLVCGRSASNCDPEEDYLVWTADGDTWSGIKAPEPLWPDGISLNVRALYSDDKNIYTVGPDGMIPNTEQPGPPYVNAPDFFFTSDFGEHWTHVSGLPARTYPLTLCADDDYIYTAIYSPIPTNAESGLWRIAKSELTAGVASISSDKGVTVRVADNSLLVSAKADRVAVFSADGKAVLTAENVESVNLNALGNGIYIYEVVAGEAKVSGKFIK